MLTKGIYTKLLKLSLKIALFLASKGGNHQMQNFLRRKGVAPLHHPKII